LAGFADNLLAELERIPPTIRQDIERALALPKDDPGRSLTWGFVLTLCNEEAFSLELQRLGEELTA
jgi:hypothetical protein